MCIVSLANLLFHDTLCGFDYTRTEYIDKKTERYSETFSLPLLRLPFEPAVEK